MPSVTEDILNVAAGRKELVVTIDDTSVLKVGAAVFVAMVLATLLTYTLFRASGQ